MSDMEDAGYAEAMRRLSLLKVAHSGIISSYCGTGSEFDEQYPGQTALASLTDGHLVGGAGLASANGANAAASAVADKIETTGSP